jgi:hypothetical protein
MAINAAIAGSGTLVLRDANGNSCPLGTMQSAALDTKGETRELTGANKMPVLVAEVGRKMTLTATFAEYSSALINLWLGGTIATGSRWISLKAKTATASSFTVATADDGTPAGWAFITDLGVRYAATGQPLKYNPGTLAATGEYKNTAGVYTLGTGDATASVIANYVWSQTAGERNTFSNSAIGLANYFTAYVQQQTTQADGTVRKILWEFPAVILPSLKIDFKNTDFMSQSVEMSVFCDSSGVFAYQSAI